MRVGNLAATALLGSIAVAQAEGDTFEKHLAVGKGVVVAVIDMFGDPTKTAVICVESRDDAIYVNGHEANLGNLVLMKGSELYLKADPNAETTIPEARGVSHVHVTCGN